MEKKKYGKCFKYEDSYYWNLLKRKQNELETRIFKLRTELSHMRHLNKSCKKGELYYPQEFELLESEKAAMQIYRDALEMQIKLYEEKLDSGDEVVLASWMEV